MILTRVGAFGCFDDCFNIGAGYFIGKGRRLFSEIFFNHQPSMAYLSYLVQTFYRPGSLYELIRFHRLAIWMIVSVFTFLSVLRFGFSGFLAVFFYIFLAIYAFGDRFLGESIVAPAIGFLFGLSYVVFQKRRLTIFDGIVAIFILWLVIFTREPYIPIAVVLFGIILSGFAGWKRQLMLGLLIILLCGITVSLLPVNDWWYQVVMINKEYHVGSALTLPYIWSMIVYPVIQLVSIDPWTILRLNTGIVTVAFIISIFLGGKRLKPLLLLTVISLAITNTRPTSLSKMYYEAFHMLPWLAVLSEATSFALIELTPKKRLVMVIVVVLIFSTIQFVRKDSFFNEHIDRQYEFVTGYNTYYVYGEAVKRISAPADTLFVDGWDELIYWQAGLVNGYPMSWYTTMMPKITKYQDQRSAMFMTNPPDFYYGRCSDAPSQSMKLPDELMSEYTNVLFNGRPTCLFVHNKKVSQVSAKQRDDLKALELTIP